MTQKRRKRCPHCGFLDTIKRGKRAGYSRYFCKNCNSYFTDRRPSVTQSNMFVWFENWVRDKQSIPQISKASGYSERTLKNYFYKILPTCPTWQIQKREKVNLMIDGTYFTNKVCLLLYRDYNIKQMLSRVNNHIEAQYRMKEFIDWEDKYHEYISEKSIDEVSGRWWYTHKMLHRSVTHIKRAIPYMFNYTRYSAIPKTSNSIESFFGHLKDHLRLHRGLSEEHFKDFIKWYLFLQSNQGKAVKKWERETNFSRS